MAKRKRKRYTDKFRATAVVMLEAQGYPDKDGALTTVANHLNVPLSTLRGWFTAERNPPPAELRNEKKRDLVALIENEIYGALDEMGKKRAEAEYRELATGFGIMFDKVRLLKGEPTGIVKVVRMIQEGSLSHDAVREKWPNLASELFARAGIVEDV